MGIPTIVLYASPPSTVCSTPHPCQITSHSSHDFDFTARSSSSSSSSAPHGGGLSSLFSSQPVKYAASTTYHTAGEDDRTDELTCSFRYSSSGSSLKKDHSPVSVFQAPLSSSRSPPTRIGGRERNTVDVNLHASFRAGANNNNNSLFNGLVPNALGSCVDYDSPTFQAHGDPFESDSTSVLVDEFPLFSMDDAFAESKDIQNSKDLLLDAQSRHTIFYDDFVVKAFYEAEKAHRGQVRASGEPYLQHCLETAVLLASIGATSTVVAAGLLHDTLDDSFMSYDHIFSNFGAGVAELVEGVSKLSHLSKLARDNNTACKTVEADRLHTMFLAMTDARAVLIKLADRLHNMKTLDALPLDKQERISKETLEIFAPLANRLGICSWKEQLENLCFRHLYPEQYRNLSSKLMKSYDEAAITCASEKLEGALKDEGISYHVLSGRHKSLYGIHAKMLKKKLTVDEVHDIHGLRLIVEKKEDCYRALKVIHQLWSEVPGKFKDYIDHPKFNGYQSLHTVVRGEGGMVPLEVQIRTKEMHVQAEIGFAAHWRYKEEGDEKHASFVLQMVEWARWVISWQCEAATTTTLTAAAAESACKFPSHEKDCRHTTYRHDCYPDGPIYVIIMENDKMSVEEFPAGCRLWDMLESSSGRGQGRFRWWWSPDGGGFPRKEELRPRLNSKPINDPSCKLMMGDVVELTPAIPDKSLTQYREEMQRMYDHHHNRRALSSSSSLLPPIALPPTTTTTSTVVMGWRT